MLGDLQVAQPSCKAALGATVPASVMNTPPRVQATAAERARTLPGDRFIPAAIGTLTHAITINCSRAELWPWLEQMGAGRAGWYSYDLLDNGGRRSAEEILPGFQHPPVGSVFPALPGSTDGFVLIDRVPARWLVLGWPAPDGSQIVTWAFVLEDRGPDRTRLIVRARASARYSFLSMPKPVGVPLARLVHFIMERKQLVEIARRAEGRVHPVPALVEERAAS